MVGLRVWYGIVKEVLVYVALPPVAWPAPLPAAP